MLHSTGRIIIFASLRLWQPLEVQSPPPDLGPHRKLSFRLLTREGPCHRLLLLLLLPACPGWGLGGEGLLSAGPLLGPQDEVPVPAEEAEDAVAARSHKDKEHDY